MSNTNSSKPISSSDFEIFPIQFKGDAILLVVVEVGWPMRYFYVYVYVVEVVRTEYILTQSCHMSVQLCCCSSRFSGNLFSSQSEMFIAIHSFVRIISSDIIQYFTRKEDATARGTVMLPLAAKVLGAAYGRTSQMPSRTAFLICSLVSLHTHDFQATRDLQVLDRIGHRRSLSAEELHRAHGVPPFSRSSHLRVLLILCGVY